MDIAGRIRSRRKELGLSQAALAGKLKLSTTAVNAWEVGRSRPWENLVALANVLEVTTDWLLGKEEKVRSKTLTIADVFKIKHGEVEEMQPMPQVHKLPVLDQPVAANLAPTHAASKDFEYVDVKYAKDQHYCLKVKGQSMTPTIFEGDIVIVQRLQMRLDEYDEDRGPADKQAWKKMNNEIVIAVVDDDDNYVIKRLRIKDRKDTGFKINLMSDNPAAEHYEITRDSRLFITGLVKKIMRDTKYPL